MKWLLLWSALFGVVFATALALLLETGVLTPVLVESVDARLADVGLRFQAGQLYWRPWSGLTLGNVALRPSALPDSAATWDPAAGGSPAAAQDRLGPGLVLIDKVEVGYRVLGLLSGQPRLDRVRVVRPRVNLDALAEWNRRSFVRADSTHASSAGVGGPSFAIADLEIVDGALHSEAGLQVTGLHLEGSVGGRSGSWRIEVETAGTRIRTPRIDEQVELTGDVLVEDGIVRLQGLHFGAAGGRVSLKGHFDPSSREESVLQANGFAIPLEKVGAWVGVEHPLLFANLEFSLLAAGRPDSLRLSGEFDGKGEGGLDRSIHFSGTRTREKLRVETMHIETGPSIVDVQGELTLEEDPVIRGVAVFRQLDPSVLLADPELAGVRALDGAVRFDGVGITRDRFRGNAHLELSGGEVFGYRFDRASARINVDRGAVVLEEGTVQHGGSELTGQGSIGRDNLVTASLIGNIVDLNDFGGAALADVELSGQATLEMSVEGPLAGPAIDASLRFEESSVYGIRARTLDLKLSSERVGGGGEADVRITARELGYGERAIPQATAQGVLRGGAIVVQSLDLLSSRRGELHLSGELSLGAGGEVAGRVEVLEVRAPDGASAWTNDGFVTVERTENSLVVTGLNLRSEGGSIAGDISVAGNGESSVLATGTAVDLSLFSPYLLLPKALGGTLNFRADVLVGRERVEGDVAFELHDGQWGDDTLQRLEGNVTAADSVLSFHQVQLEASFATGNLEGDVAIPGGSFAGVLFDPPSRPALLDRMVFRNLHAELDSPDYDWFWDLLPNAPRVAGAGSFEADIDGPLLDPTARAHLDLTGGRLGTKPMDRLRVDGTYRGLDLTFMNGEIVSGDGVLTFDGTLPFQWNFQQPVPRIPSGRELDLHLMATDFPAGTLSSMLPLFEAVEGTAQADLQWKGADGSLHLLGEFSVDDASIRIPTIAEPLVDGHVEGLFDREGNVRLTVARFTDGAGGLVTGVGIVQLDNLKLVDYHLDVIGQNYHYVGLGLGIRGLGTGELAITGVEGKSGNVVPRFTGNVEVLRADLDERALTPPETALIGPQMPAGVSPPEETAPDAPSQPVERAEIYAEVALHGDRNIWLRTPEMDLEMAGDVTLHVTPEYAGLTGESRSLRGTYSVLNSRFNVERAEVEFIDPSQPMESYIDAEATTAVLDEDVTVLVSGTLANPVIELSTDSGMTEAEIYEMLALRIKRTDTGDVEGGVLDSAFRSSYLAAFTNRFGGELSRELGFDTFDFDAGSSDQGSSVTFGKRVGRDFFVKYRESVGSAQDETTLEATRESLESPERALTLEYRLSRIFTLQGETGTLKIGDEYLNVDLKLQWGY